MFVQTNVSGQQWLFNGLRQPHGTRTICLRHDVDACVWQPLPSPSSVGESSVRAMACEHTATFDALGYVQASKQNRKFITAPRDCSYAVVCECSRNVFVYFPDSRQKPCSRALQSVFTLPRTSSGADSTVLGIVPLSRRRVFVLTQEHLLLLSIDS